MEGKPIPLVQIHVRDTGEKNVILFFLSQILIAGMCLPWLGFTFGFIVAYVCKQPQANIRAIAIETGIQNTGVAIFLLRFTLKPPSDDLTTGKFVRIYAYVHYLRRLTMFPFF